MGIPIVDFSKSNQACEKLKAKLENLMMPDNYIRVLVEINEIPRDKEFVFRIIGKYTQNSKDDC